MLVMRPVCSSKKKKKKRTHGKEMCNQLKKTTKKPTQSNTHMQQCKPTKVTSKSPEGRTEV